MGITGLIPFMEKSSRTVSISEFSGCSVAVDAYCWLHKGAYSCIEQLVNGEPCTQYIKYCINLIRMLQSHNVHPILVFDGRHLPAKAETEEKRRQSREQSRKRAAELLRAGRRGEARSFLQRCLDITHEHALAVINAVRPLGVDCIVAPYESDAQMAFLNLNEIVQLVITEDSDLVLFGCHKILFKMDSTGSGILVERDRLYLSMGIRQDLFSLDMFRYMAILSGCDYLPSLPGIGLGKACKFIKQARGFEIHRALLRLPQVLKMKLNVPDEYRDEFLRADSTFRYQIIYDPILKKQRYLNEPEPGQKPPSCVGELIENDMQTYQMALGNLEPFTLKCVNDWDPCTKPVRPLGGFKSIWDRRFKPQQPLRRSPRKHVSPMKTITKVMQCNVEKLVQKIGKKFDSIENEDLESIYGANMVKTSPEKEEPVTEESEENEERNESELLIISSDKKIVNKEKEEQIETKNTSNLKDNKSETNGVKRPAEESPHKESCQIKRNHFSPGRNPFLKSPPSEISPNLLGLNKFKPNIVIKSRYFHHDPPKSRTSLFKCNKPDDEVLIVPETQSQESFVVPETPPNKLPNSPNSIHIVNETPNETNENIFIVPETLENESESQSEDILLVPETVPVESPLKEIMIVPETPADEYNNSHIVSSFSINTAKPTKSPTSPIISRYNKKRNSRLPTSTQSTLAMFGFKTRSKI